jgi:hypothetical protein
VKSVLSVAAFASVLSASVMINRAFLKLSIRKRISVLL